jgi:hypothetical protein
MRFAFILSRATSLEKLRDTLRPFILDARFSYLLKHLRPRAAREQVQEGIVMETIYYQNAFTKAKQRENAGKFQTKDIASLKATDDTLPDAKMGLLLPCRMVTIKDTRRMGMRSGDKWPEDDRSTQFRGHSKADDGAGIATKGSFGIPKESTPAVGPVKCRAKPLRR